MLVQEDKMERRGGKPQVAESNLPGTYKQMYVLGRGKTEVSSTSEPEGVYAYAQSPLGDKKGIASWTIPRLSPNATSVETARVPLFTAGNKTLH